MFLISGSAFAQEHGRGGLSMGYPANISVIWHVTERIAIRPGVSVVHNSVDFSSNLTFSFGGVSISTTTTTESTAVGLATDALFYVKSWDNVRAYVAGGYEYRRFTAKSVSSTVDPLPGATRTETRRTTTNGHQVIGTFGAQYTPHRRFGVFGEVGVSYSESAARSLEPDFRTVSTSTGAGIVFYF